MEKIIEPKGVDLPALLGVADAHLRSLEDSFEATLLVRGNRIKIEGSEEQVNLVHEVLHEMIQTLGRKGSLTPRDVKQLIRYVHADDGRHPRVPEAVVHYGPKGAISPRSEGQVKYLGLIQANDIIFSIGPAGTGKTYLAVATAVAELENHAVEQIILCRPAVEAGENLGFLPGDLREKVDPYLTPLYDALGDMLPASRLKHLLTKKVIEVIPLAYMRGRTLNNAFLILDEAQNATTMQMKMFLTRLGVNSKAIVTGDITQIDLPQRTQSGLLQVLKILQKIDGIGFALLSEIDVVRHHLVQDIIRAYDDHNSPRH